MSSRIAFRCKLCEQYIDPDTARATFDAGNRSSIHSDIDPESDCRGLVTCVKPPDEDNTPLVVEGICLDDFRQPEPVSREEFFMFQFSYVRYIQ